VVTTPLVEEENKMSEGHLFFLKDSRIRQVVRQVLDPKGCFSGIGEKNGHGKDRFVSIVHIRVMA